MNEVAQRADLKQYRDTGHWVREGKLVTTPVHVVFTPYAQKRMSQRGIDESEVLELLTLPRGSHGPGREEGRFEVAGIAVGGPMRAVYERPALDIALIVTTYPEFD